MKKVLLPGVLCIIILTSMIAEKSTKSLKANSTTSGNTATTAANAEAEVNYLVDSLYSNMQLSESGLSRSVFFDAYKGYRYLLAAK